MCPTHLSGRAIASDGLPTSLPRFTSKTETSVSETQSPCTPYWLSMNHLRHSWYLDPRCFHLFRRGGSDSLTAVLPVHIVHPYVVLKRELLGVS